jgi:hypothetical protein
MTDVTSEIFGNPYNKQESRAELKHHSPLHLSYYIALTSSMGNLSLSIVLPRPYFSYAQDLPSFSTQTIL